MALKIHGSSCPPPPPTSGAPSPPNALQISADFSRDQRRKPIVLSFIAAVSLIPAVADASPLNFITSSMNQPRFPHDVSLKMAIPIPAKTEWSFLLRSGFAAPIPWQEEQQEEIVYKSCAPWQAGPFEMVLPDGVRPKPYPKDGSQWPAMADPAPDHKTGDPIQEIERLIDSSNKSCFSL